MAKCANCSKDALYSYNVSGDFVINYCQSHLPRFLYTRTGEVLANRIEVVNPTVIEPEVEVLPEIIAQKKAKAKVVKEVPVVEEAPVTEEPALEEAPSED